MRELRAKPIRLRIKEYLVCEKSIIGFREGCVLDLGVCALLMASSNKSIAGQKIVPSSRKYTFLSVSGPRHHQTQTFYLFRKMEGLVFLSAAGLRSRLTDFGVNLIRWYSFVSPM